MKVTAGSMLRALLPVAALAVIAAVPAKAEFRDVTGDLSAFLNLTASSIPGPDSEAFRVPPPDDLAEFGAALVQLLRRNYQTAADLADRQGYDLVRFSDLGSDLQPYYVLIERTGSGFRGQGTFVFNPAARRRLSIQAPHVPSDNNTGSESIQMFLELDAEFWQMNGTHRCANDALAHCSDDTDACGGAHEPYRNSDVAHFPENFFQVANDTVAATLPGIFSFQLHSFGCPNADPLDAPLAQLSNVSSATMPGSMATRLALEINERVFAAGYPGRGAISWNATATDPDEVQIPVNVCKSYHGRANVQGRSLHGSSEPCTTAVSAVPAPERFLHIEQRSLLTRAGPGGPDHLGISRDLVIAAIAELFPAAPQRWVNFTHIGVEAGIYAFPHNTLREAIDAASPGETIRIRAGTTSETGTFSGRVLLQGFDGPAIIGN